MQLEFFRTNNAINYTIAFYEIGKIKDHLLIFAGKDPNSKYKLEWYDLMFTVHKQMEGEIMQIILTTNHNTHTHFLRP